MWTDAVVEVLANVAVGAQDLEDRREVICDDPSVEGMTAQTLSAMFRAVIVNVI